MDNILLQIKELGKINIISYRKPYDNWDIKEEMFGWKRIDFNPKL